MTFTTFDIALPLVLGAGYGVIRYFSRREADPENALRTSALDAGMAIAIMAMMTVLLKYL
jgi:hypothetical protein